ncbi:unnamed protein product [Rhizoctonia solani]|uniref:Uncharacterized protein n=1 Tax=Rhizoctonia solani TaxID=456999 RepID=A0A8H3C9D1_9AGAM|nr:unnamed protein product [Rhizoctonia solani]
MAQSNYALAEASAQSVNPHGSTHSEALLSFDVIMLISEELRALGRTNDLAAMCLLGRRYTHPIQRVLFRHIHLTAYDQYSRILRVLRTVDNPQRCPGFSSMVHQLSAVLDPQTTPTLGQDCLLELYESLPMLKRVELREVRRSRLGRSLVPAEEDLSRLGALESIRSVTLTHLGPMGVPMLVSLPYLEELHLFGDIPESLFSNASPRSGCKLRRLTWGATMHPTLQRIRWIFGESDEAIGGEVVILFLPNPESERNAIAQYARRRGMAFRVVVD